MLKTVFLPLLQRCCLCKVTNCVAVCNPVGAGSSCLSAPFGAGHILVTESIKNACVKWWDNYSKFVWGWIAAAREILKCVWEKIAVFRVDSSWWEVLQHTLQLLVQGHVWNTSLGAVVQLQHPQGCCQHSSPYMLKVYWHNVVFPLSEQFWFERVHLHLLVPSGMWSEGQSFCLGFAWLMQQTINLQTTRISPNATLSVCRR